MSLFINSHVIQTHSVNNLNRDDTGEQKSCIFGNTKRARISSQCQKYYMRHSTLFIQLAEKYGLEISTRTNDTEALAKLLNADEELIKAKIGFGAVMSVGLNELDIMIKEDKELGEAPMPLDVALFGRMFAKKNYRNDAACTVPHAFTVNSIAGGDYDWFTATDDLRVTGGSSYLDSNSFSTGSYYKNASIDVCLLAENLRIDPKKAAELAIEVLYVLSITSIKSNASNGDNYTLPIFIMFEISERPVSYSNVFEKQCNSDEAVLRLKRAPVESIEVLMAIAEILGTTFIHDTVVISDGSIRPISGLATAKECASSYLAEPSKMIVDKSLSEKQTCKELEIDKAKNPDSKSTKTKKVKKA